MHSIQVVATKKYVTAVINKIMFKSYMKKRVNKLCGFWLSDCFDLLNRRADHEKCSAEKNEAQSQ